jgi:PAS domain S-box-containing protein
MNLELEKRVEERSAEYQKSEEKYHSLIEQASDAIYVLDFKGNFTNANASMCKMMGYACAELMQMRIEMIIDPEELKIDPLPTGIKDSSQSTIRERRFIRKNGSVFTVEVNVKKFTDDRIMVIARDITGRKKMETELRDAELKFRTIADKSMVGVYIVQHGVFTYVNPRFAAIFGYHPEELINTFPVETVIADSHKHIAVENVRRRITGETESIHYEILGKRKDGTNNWVEFYGSRATINNQPTIIGSMIDITERKKAEEELRSSEHQYKILFESNPSPMWMIAKDDLSIIAVNDAAARLYGYSKEELLQMNVTAFRTKEDLEKQAERYHHASEGYTEPLVIKHIKKDKNIMFVEVIAYDIVFEGRPVRLSLTNDVTEKLKAEESLRKSEANLQTMLNTTDTAYAMFDLDLRVLAFNQKAAAFVQKQYHHKPEKGGSLADYFPPERFPEFTKFTKQALKGNNINYETDFLQEDGSVLWFYISLFPITNDQKDILGMMMSLYDITERKNAEENLKNAYERIQSQIKSIKDMAWKQSHLIRSPLANLKGLTTLLQEAPAEKEIFEYIQNELDRMDAIIIEMAVEASNHDFED